jgi:hypothetical protein
MEKKYIVYVGLQLGPQEIFTEYRISLLPLSLLITLLISLLLSLLLSILLLLLIVILLLLLLLLLLDGNFKFNPCLPHYSCPFSSA